MGDLSAQIVAEMADNDATEDRRISSLSGLQWLLPLLGLIFLWPAIVNRAPFHFPDTSAYVRGVDAAALRLFGVRTEWTNADVVAVAAHRAPKTVDAAGRKTVQRATGAAPEQMAAEIGAPVAAGQNDIKPVLLGRSVYYGALAYLGAILGMFWLTIIVQALLAGAVIVGAVRHAVDPGDRRRFAITCSVVIAVLALTPLAYFVCMVMPDLFAGLLVVAAAALLAGWRRERTAGRALWAAVASAAALVHSSHVLMLIAIAGLALGAAAIARRPALVPSAALLFGCALIGMAGEIVFEQCVTRLTGTSPIRPPFLTARLIEDGPGMAVLERHCDSASFHLCHVRDRLPLPSDAFLWSDEGGAIFRGASAAEQRALSDEQSRFVLTAVRETPDAVLAAALAATGRQFLLWRLPEFHVAAEMTVGSARAIPENVGAAIAASRSAHGTMPVGLAEAVTACSIPLAMMLLLWAWIDPRTVRAAQFATVLTAGWLAGVVICGTLSTPHDRYQARVVWLLTFAVLILAHGLWNSFVSRTTALAWPARGAR